MVDEKPVKYALFAVIRNPENPLQIMAVKRPDDDKDLPGVWGLPTISYQPYEKVEDVVRRLGRTKLGVELRVKEILGKGNLDRGNFILHGEEFEAEIVSGIIRVPQKPDGRTQYSDWKYADWTKFLDAASKGSLCSNLYLMYLGQRPLQKIFQ